MALIVIEVLTSPSGSPSSRTRHVGEARDRDADPAHLPLRLAGVGVVAHLGRQVEGDRQPGLALLEQVAEAPVRLLGGREAGVLAHRPEAAAVHRRLDAAGERVLAGRPEVAVLVEAGRVGRRCRGRGSRSPTRSRSGRAAPGAAPSALARSVSRQRSRPGSGPSPIGPVRAGHSEDHEEVAELDGLARRPRRPARRSRRAGRGARSASSSPRPRGAAGRPRPRRPATTDTRDHAPGMMARTSVGPPWTAAVAGRGGPVAQAPLGVRLDLDLDPPAVDDDLARRRRRRRPRRRCAGASGARRPGRRDRRPARRPRRAWLASRQAGWRRSAVDQRGPSVGRDPGSIATGGGPRPRSTARPGPAPRAARSTGGSAIAHRGHRSAASRAAGRRGRRAVAPAMPSPVGGAADGRPSRRRRAVVDGVQRRGQPRDPARPLDGRPVPVLAHPAGRQVAGPERRRAGPRTGGTAGSSGSRRSRSRRAPGGAGRWRRRGRRRGP